MDPSLCSSSFEFHHAGRQGLLQLGLIGWIADGAARERGVTDGLLNWLALPTHLTAFMRGVVASVDVAYFLLLVVLCLGLAAMRLARLRELG